ncbi:MAG: hypothetical protein NZ908_00505 [Candidatus Micrarchaeota archaeon]|nr:hypothetical protein [Candidatus Micrarchaeota archaeon]MCX8154552.1 hypothetical protein [Candidatus Micrarchaeota archaeon]
MGEKVGNELIKKEKGYLYYVGKDGKVYRVPMKYMRSKVKSTAPEAVSKEMIKREQGYLYYVGKSGYVERVKANRGRKKV